METPKSNVIVVPATKSNRAEIAAAVEAKGFTINRGGLGLPAGDYEVTTAPGEDIFALKAIKTNAGKTIALPIVAGTVVSKDGKHNVVCGLGEKDKNLVVPYSAWSVMEPNSRYSFTLNDKGYVNALASVSSDESLQTPAAPAAQPSALAGLGL